MSEDSKTLSSLLKTGLENRDWELINEAYQLVTGESIDLSDHDSTNQLLDLMREALNKQKPVVKTTLKTTKADKPTKKVGKPGRPKKTSTTVTADETRFISSTDEEDDPAIKKLNKLIIQKHKPTKRTRANETQKTVICSVCEKDTPEGSIARTRIAGGEDGQSSGPEYTCHKCFTKTKASRR